MFKEGKKTEFDRHTVLGNTGNPQTEQNHSYEAPFVGLYIYFVNLGKIPPVCWYFQIII